MGKVVFDISMSLDGYMTASHRTAEEPLGSGGERLHEWAFGEDATNRKLMEDAVGALGAVICGRTTYDDSIRWWGADGPTGPAQRPVFVVTHEPPSESPEDGVYAFVTEGIEHALELAKRVAGDNDVTIMGGARLGRQYIQARVVDELSIHLVPMLFTVGRGCSTTSTASIRSSRSSPSWTRWAQRIFGTAFATVATTRPRRDHERPVGLGVRARRSIDHLHPLIARPMIARRRLCVS